MFPYQKGTRTQALSTNLQQNTFNDKGCLMRGFSAQLRQELTQTCMCAKKMTAAACFVF
jgi:hypothetical protein